MARSARECSIDPNQIQIVHVWNRCVRRAFLCGVDHYSGRNYEHRRVWARERLEHLASLFAIDCMTYSIMSNHTHQILRSRPDIVAEWDDHEVARRWLKISPARDAKGRPLEPKDADIQSFVSDAAKIAELRQRLSDISWWMRYFSHHMACRSNKEDEISGHFWESRFGSEVIESEAATVACMIYVDLNPIRAGMAANPEESEYTGAKDRIDDLRICLGTTSLGDRKLVLQSSTHTVHDWERLGGEHSGWMSPVEIDETCDPIGCDKDSSGRRASRKGAVAISLTRYLQLLDWAGRIIRGDKRGAIPIELEPILCRLGFNGKSLIRKLWSFGSPPGERWVPVNGGTPASIPQTAH